MHCDWYSSLADWPIRLFPSLRLEKVSRKSKLSKDRDVDAGESASDADVDMDDDDGDIVDDKDEEDEVDEESSDSSSDSSSSSCSKHDVSSSASDKSDRVGQSDEDLEMEFLEFWGQEVELDTISGEATPSGPSAPPPPPPHPPPAMPMFEVPVRLADVTFEIPGVGKIFYYSHLKRFTASCAVHKCTFSKTSNESEDNPAAGRPVGTLIAWLVQNQPPASVSKAAHACLKNKRSIPLDLRQQGRDLCRLLESGAELLASERPQRTGEPEEPVGQP